VDRVEVVRQAYRAHRARRFGDLLQLLHPEVELEPFLTGPQQTYKGIPEIERFYTKLQSTWKYLKPYVLSISEFEHHVLVAGHVTGVLRQHERLGGIGVSGWWVWEFDEDRVRSVRAYQSEEEALDAIGMAARPVLAVARKHRGRSVVRSAPRAPRRASR
jgi:ketosteroid isomerase-like protein